MKKYLLILLAATLLISCSRSNDRTSTSLTTQITEQGLFLSCHNNTNRIVDSVNAQVVYKLELTYLKLDYSVYEPVFVDTITATIHGPIFDNETKTVTCITFDTVSFSKFSVKRTADIIDQTITYYN